MNVCSCYKDVRNKNKRILIRTSSCLRHGEVLSTFYCIKCGCQTYNYDNSLVIDIEELNVPLEAIVFEFNRLLENFKCRNINPCNALVFNIMYAIVWMYEVDYYQKFDDCMWVNIKCAIISFFLENKSELTCSFFKSQKNYEKYIKFISESDYTKTRNFNLESALSNPNLFEKKDFNCCMYGPVALISNEYTTPSGEVRKSNNFYYVSDKYFRDNRSKLEQDAKTAYISIKQKLCSYLVKHCNKFPSDLCAKVKSFKELRAVVMANNFGEDRVFLTGFLRVFAGILENADVYVNISSRTYKDFLKELEIADAFVDEHVR